jgi:uncharacterized protein (TIGR03083 family)
MDDDRTSLLGQVWAQWAVSVSGIDESDWSAPTRCGDWSVRTLVAHVGDGVLGFHTALRDRMVEREADTPSAARLMERLKPDAAAARVMAEKADQRARRSSEREIARLVEPFHAPADEMLQLASAHRDGVVDYFGRADVSVDGLVELALLEAAVHYLDLSAALGSGADLSSEVMRSVAGTLMSMTSPQVLIEVATGRRQASEVFPVHS